jgi:predicted RNA-binding Zn-ribbon protein involved in translation (DUF1610 family)
MFRQLGGLISIVSAVLCIVVIVEWVRSRHHVDLLVIRTPMSHVVGAAADRGGLLFAQSDLPYTGEEGPDGQDHSVMLASVAPDDPTFSQIRDTILDTTAIKFSFLGFKTAAGQTTLTGTLSPRFSAIVLPYWFVAILLAILPSGIGRAAWTRRQRRRKGLCIACGYDIRASSGRCPECGREIPATREATLAKI